MEKVPPAQIEQALLQIPDIRAARLVTDHSGKPVEVHSYPDLAGMMMQLGLMPMPGA